MIGGQQVQGRRMGDGKNSTAFKLDVEFALDSELTNLPTKATFSQIDLPNANPCATFS